ncbi:MAG: Asp-tRNA(Asn)/Glu-tRNA(Gln) amidotransferase subunit GatB [Promethearchaeota archaeon]|jgi:aspartyl-tRNA(Asn)/glutamyl-tRNA(Gln) amidotransferase subunit B
MKVEEFKAKIGLEIHVQLTYLNTKLFCGCSADYRGKAPNTHLCPTCIGLPGTLPVVNKRAVEGAIMVALALRSKIQTNTLFYRKNYYYPDMSKNFQISQYDKAGGVPFSIGGNVSIQIENIGKDIRIRRIQLEEDPAKLVHPGSIDKSPYSLVDYNRAGVTLVEIVTEPDMESPKEARIFLQKLRSILEHLEVSDGKLDGAMRCDANISTAGGKRVEIKNISSFKEVERALSYEIMRQRTLLSRGFKVEMETRHWDETRRVTITLRTKESEDDYRYFPEPDLVPVIIKDEQLQKLETEMPELPDARRDRLVEQYKIPYYDANVLTREKTLTDFFEQCVRLYPNAKEVSNWIMGDLLKSLHWEGFGIDEAKISPQNLVEMIQMIDNGRISGKIGKKILPEMVRTGRSPSEIIEEKGLTKISSRDEIEKLTEKIFADNPQAVKDALRDERAAHYLTGQIMKITKGRADPKITNLVIKEKLDKLRT